MIQAADTLMAPAQLTRTRNMKRDYKCLADGPIDAEVLNDAATQARLRRACAALPRDPNEPPRKRGRPRKERPLAADEQQTSSSSTSSSMSTNTDIDVRELHLWQKRGRSTSASPEKEELASNVKPPRTSQSPAPTDSLRSSSQYAQIIHGDINCYNDFINTIDKPVNLHSPVEDVAALLLAVAEQARLERAAQAQSPQSFYETTKARNIAKTKGRKGRNRKQHC